MKHGSLFSGIGGFDLAAKWMGWRNVFQVEIDKFCQKVLEKNFPFTKKYEDIRKFNGKKWNGKIDILTGGFPCQPFSIAGKRRGKEDGRYLWPEMLRVIIEINPAFVIAENVLGIINMALSEILADLENAEYRTEVFVIPACAIGAPHKRDRIWIIAHSNGVRCEWGEQGLQSAQKREDAQTCLLERELRKHWDGNNLPTPRICRSYDGLPNRLDRIRALGNAIVPQIAFEIFKIIEKYEAKKTKTC